MPKALPAPEVEGRARTALMHAQTIDLTAIPKCPMRSRAVAKKRGYFGTAEDYALRFSGQRTVPPGCTLEMLCYAAQIVEICQREWPDPAYLARYTRAVPRESPRHRSRAETRWADICAGAGFR